MMEKLCELTAVKRDYWTIRNQLGQPIHIVIGTAGQRTGAKNQVMEMLATDRSLYAAYQSETVGCFGRGSIIDRSEIRIYGK
jgi:hypothetical protein